MAPVKAVPGLAVLSSQTVSRAVGRACRRLENFSKSDVETGETELVELLAVLPPVLLEPVIAMVTTQLTGAGQAGLCTALRLLPRPGLNTLDLSPLFTGARLSRGTNTRVRAALASSLARCTSLTKLVMTSRATDELLQVVGSHCCKVQELRLTSSELVTDTGVTWLVPSTYSSTSASLSVPSPKNGPGNPQRGCPDLITLDLLKCWNISAGGARLLLCGLPRLRKLLYPNMKSVLEQLVVESSQPTVFPALEYFDSSEYDLQTECSGAGPDSNPASWLAGPVSLAQVPRTFPHLTTAKMMLSDGEAASLVLLPCLTHIELEFSDDPGPGLLSLLEQHPNNSNFTVLFFQLGVLLAGHLVALARHCTALTILRIIGFQVEGAAGLVGSAGYWPRLAQLHLSLYSEDPDSSEEEDGEAGRQHRPEILQFFLHSAVRLRVLQAHLNCSAWLTDSWLAVQLAENPLCQLARLGLGGPGQLQLSHTTARWLASSLPALVHLNTTNWNISTKQLAALRTQAANTNMDLVYE